MCGVKPTAGRVWKLWNCYNRYEGWERILTNYIGDKL
tara:strand:- start:197 stop:307 length:111 start_codon:yes stop_codon:yes gene_type:complete